jgi:hypothetical protein
MKIFFLLKLTNGTNKLECLFPLWPVAKHSGKASISISHCSSPTTTAQEKEPFQPGLIFASKAGAYLSGAH